MASIDQDAAPVSTGASGLDHILDGGYASRRSHLIEGRPGSGKTTLAMQFLLDGVRRGARPWTRATGRPRRALPANDAVR